jgi:ATP-dependent DNA helicase RecG
MFREMIRNGKSLPRVEETASGAPETIITFIGGPPNSRVAKFLAGLPLHEQNDTDTTDHHDAL